MEELLQWLFLGHQSEDPLAKHALMTVNKKLTLFDIAVD